MAEVTADDITYRVGDLKDVRNLYHRLFARGWPLSYPLVEGFFKSCPEAFRIAEYKAEVIGYCMGNILNDEEAFVSFLIVNEEHRRKGIGGRLLNTCMKAFGDRNITLYSNMEARHIYLNYHGFRGYVEKPRTVVMATCCPEREAFAGFKEVTGVNFIPLRDVALAELDEYDTRIHVVSRRKYLAEYQQLEHSIAAVRPENSSYSAVPLRSMVGYACLFFMGESKYGLGPVLADTPQIAQALVAHLLSRLPEGNSLMSIYEEDNPGNKEIITRLGPMDVAFPLEIMYTKHQANVLQDNVFFHAGATYGFA